MTSRATRVLSAGVAVLLILSLAAFKDDTPPERPDAGTPETRGPTPCTPWPICNINRVIFIVQENRSFDHYFGTYQHPSGLTVLGLPRKPGGAFKPCMPHPFMDRCSKPFHSTNLSNLGGPHSHTASIISVNDGKMDGFIRAAKGSPQSGPCIQDPTKRSCRKHNGPGNQPDLMGFHTDAEIPNYWAYADWGVLQDKMFQPVDSWSLPAHLYLVSAWSATCTSKTNPMSCSSDPRPNNTGSYPWTDVTDLLFQNGVSWGYYVGEETSLNCGYPQTPQDCQRGEGATPPGWNPLLWFRRPYLNGQQGNVQHVSSFVSQVQNDTLPQVSWVIPSGRDSEHPGHGSLNPGHAYVTNLINEVAQSAVWDDVAIFLTWDDWGGFYDHMKPIRVDAMGYGLRVPGIVLSPYAKSRGGGDPTIGCVDHQVLSFDAYLKFIEDRWLSSERPDPTTMLNRDSRPNVREDEPDLGDVSASFDFTQPPRDPAPIIFLPP